MAVVDPYSPCPCGSGEKFKWCCHKVEGVAERAHRLFDGGQIEAALGTLDEGLKKDPGNAWLLTRKALYLTRSNQPEPAKEAVRQVLQKNPRHAGAQVLMTRLALETEGPSAGAAELQRALTALPAEKRGSLASLVKVVAAFLAEAAEYPAALAHLKLALVLQPEEPDPSVASAIRTIQGNPSISPWLKNPDRLEGPPSGLGGEARERFDQALAWANEGLWSSAAAAFETLSSDLLAGPLADRNLGFCRLRLADNVAAVAALRRYAARLGPTTEAVDVEALCQQVAPVGSGGLVEHVQLIWPVRDRAALAAALDADPAVAADEPGPIDPDDEDSPEVDQYELLDRPALGAPTPDLKIEDVPRIVGRVLLGQEIVALETYDDGRLDRLSERFTSLAGSAIPPAHPKTKTVGKVPRLDLALMWEWLLPDGIDRELGRRLTAEQGAYLLREVWPNTPNPALRGLTPKQAAAAGDAEVPLRAAVSLFEQSRETWRDAIDFAALRVRLHIPPEPEVDPDAADLDSLHLARLALVPAERLGDEALVTLYGRARESALLDTIGRAAAVLAARPEAAERLGVETISVYTDLATIAAAKGRNEEAFDLVRRGRQAEPPAKRARNAASWDVLELRLRARSEPPESWVPEVAVLLDRYRDDQYASQTVMLTLVDMGLIQMVSHPDRPGEVLLDSRPLQALLAEYGPRVTTASGKLGVSATKPEIWTPGASAAGGGGLYIPGSASGAPPGAATGPSKIIVPGR